MHNNGSQQPIFGAASSHRAPPAPPAPPPPPPLPLFGLQKSSLQSGNAMVAGPSNFNAAFDFGSTYAVASSNYDTPFLSASESNWLFNHADLQFDTQMSQAVPSSSSRQNAHAPPPPPSMPIYAQNEHIIRNQPTHSQQAVLSPYLSQQSLPIPEAQRGSNYSNGQDSPRHHSFSMTSTSSTFPSTLSNILNPAQQRRSRHVHFADAQAFQQSQLGYQYQQDLNNGFHPPLAPYSGNGRSQNNPPPSFGYESAQISSPKVITIGLAARNRLAKHLAVGCSPLSRKLLLEKRAY